MAMDGSVWSGDRTMRRPLSRVTRSTLSSRGRGEGAVSCVVPGCGSAPRGADGVVLSLPRGGCAAGGACLGLLSGLCGGGLAPACVLAGLGRPAAGCDAAGAVARKAESETAISGSHRRANIVRNACMSPLPDATGRHLESCERLGSRACLAPFPREWPASDRRNVVAPKPKCVIRCCAPADGSPHVLAPAPTA